MRLAGELKTLLKTRTGFRKIISVQGQLAKREQQWPLIHGVDIAIDDQRFLKEASCLCKVATIPRQYSLVAQSRGDTVPVSQSAMCDQAPGKEISCRGIVGLHHSNSACPLECTTKCRRQGRVLPTGKRRMEIFSSF